MPTTSTTITVSQLTFAIKQQLEETYSEVAVEGEITNGKVHSSGHFYFDLKDAQAKISAVMFKAHFSLLAAPPKEGDRVIIYGGLSLYPPHGKYQILVRKITYQGTGELLLKLEELKKKLNSLGWFDRAHKKPLPPFPKRIGVITSPTGAVIRDILQILSRRLGRFHLVLNPVRVQGAGAAQEIALAIEQFNQYALADVLIVGRGGGSLEDLWSFNEESVARAIFQSRIPIISAVGHETDVTLADYVADVRAPTPSAAAELVSEVQYRCMDRLRALERATTHALSHLLKHGHLRLERFKRHPLLSDPYLLISGLIQHVDDFKTKFESQIRQQIHHRRLLLSSFQKETHALRPTAHLMHLRARLANYEKNIETCWHTLLSTKQRRLRELSQHLHALNPTQVLQRGYAILFALNDASVIVSSRDLLPGQRVRALLAEGATHLIVDHNE